MKFSLTFRYLLAVTLFMFLPLQCAFATSIGTDVAVSGNLNVTGNSTTTNATTTNFFATTGLITNLFGAGLFTCNSESNALTWNNGQFGCNTIPSGVTNYSSSVTYASGSYVIGSDGNLYRSLTSVSAVDPTSDTGSDWELSSVNSSVTLNVPSRFSTISTALAFVKNAKISTSAYVTIQVADGNYNYGTTEINLSNPYGAQIKILGDVTTPANVVINSSVASPVCGGLFCLTTGGTFGQIDGFKLVGPGNSVQNFGGIFAQNKSSVFLGHHMIIQNFYFSVYSANGSFVDADYATLSGGGDGNLFVYNGSSASFANGDSSGANTYFSQSGAVVEQVSSIFAPNADFHNNGGYGLLIDTGSSAMLDGASITNNTGAPLQMSADSSADLSSVTMSANGNSNTPALNGFSTTYSQYGSPVSTQTLTDTNAGSYGGLAFKQLSSTGVGFLGVQNSAGNDLTLFASSPSQSVRSVFGATGSVADFSANGFNLFGIYTYNSAPLVLGTNNTERMRILSSGNIGIGTTNPNAALDVNSSSMILEQSNTPSSSSAACTTGTIEWDSSFTYVCVATNTWKRSALATW